MKHHVRVGVACLVFGGAAALWLWNVRAVSQDWKKSEARVELPSAGAETPYEVPDALKDVIEAERKARQLMLLY